MSAADEIVAAARARAAAREADARPIDYNLAQKLFKKHKALLTRAINGKDPDKVVLACRNAVRSWHDAGIPWPDDWSRWQRALDDALGPHRSVRLEDLA